MTTFSVTYDQQTLEPWIPGESRPPFSSGECHYINAVLAEVNTRLPATTDLHFVLTHYTDLIPITGDNIVVVVIRDERGVWPRYAPQVRCVFKAYGFRPVLGPIPLSQPKISLGSSLRWLRNSAISTMNTLGSSYLEIRHKRTSRVYAVPLGYHRPIHIDWIPFDERQVDVFFSGSVEHRERAFLASLLLEDAKTVARRKMLDSLDKTSESREDLKIVTAATPGFGAQGLGSIEAYLSTMMNSKVCLAPRGNSVETYRYFEAMQCGSVIISDKQPPFWFYKDSPAIEITNWDDLPQILEQLFSDQAYLEEKHKSTLDWWQRICSEEAVANYIVSKLGLDR